MTAVASSVPAEKNTAAQKEQRQQRQQLHEITKELNKAMESSNTKLTFVVDQELNKSIVKVVDSDTNQVIRQIPSDEALHVARKISRMMGILYDTSA